MKISRSRLRHRLEKITAEQRRKWAASLTAEQAMQARYDWAGIHARDKQLPPPGDYWIWCNLSGRGVGKTVSGAELTIAKREQGVRYMGLMGESAADVRKVMVNGPSGIMTRARPWDRPEYYPSKRQIVWPATERYPWETVADLFSGDKPIQLRGPGMQFFWLDEAAKMRYLTEILETLDFSMREIPPDQRYQPPMIYISTTPIPTMAMKKLVADTGVMVTGESTWDNAANLSQKALQRFREKYDGTRLGRQEIHGELIQNVEGALWTPEMIGSNRGRLVRDPRAQDRLPLAPKGQSWRIWDCEEKRFRTIAPLTEIAIAVDPAGARDPQASSSEIGIGVESATEDGHYLIHADETMPPATRPWVWGAKVIELWHRWRTMAPLTTVVAEGNYGGTMVEGVIRPLPGGKNVNIRIVNARDAKQARAGLVSPLYDRGLVHHLGDFPQLEDQMTTWVPKPRAKSPDRVDWLTWGLHHLAIEPEPEYELVPTHPPAPWGAPRAPFEDAFR
jgi:phage terminase large subunit-like protein